MAHRAPQTRRSLPLWNPGASPATVFVTKDVVPAAPISSDKASPPLLRKRKSRSLPGGFKMAGEPFVVRLRAGPIFPDPDKLPKAASLLRSILLAPSAPPASSAPVTQLATTPPRQRRMSLPSSPPSPPASPSPDRQTTSSQLLFPPTPPPSTLRPRKPSNETLTEEASLRRSPSQVSLPPLPQTLPSPKPRSNRPSIVRGPVPPLPIAGRRRLFSEPNPIRPRSAHAPSIAKFPPPTLTTLPLPLLTLILTYTIHSVPSIHHPTFLDPVSETILPRAGWQPFLLCLVCKLVRSVSMKLLYFRVFLPPASWTATFGRPMSRVEKFARTVGRNVGIGGLVRVLEGEVKADQLLAVAPGPKRKAGREAGGGKEVVPTQALKSLAVILGSCKSLSVLSLVEPDATQPVADALSPPSSSSSSDNEDDKALLLIHPSDRRTRPRPRRHRRSTPKRLSTPPSLAALTPAKPALLTLLRPHLAALTRLQSYTHHPALPLAILPTKGWPSLSILSLPVLLPRSSTPGWPDGWAPPPSYFPSVVHTIQPFLPHVERLVLRLAKPTLAQLGKGVAGTGSRSPSTSPTRKKKVLLASTAGVSGTPLDPLLSTLTFIESLLPQVALARIVLELEGPRLSLAEEVSLVAFGIRARAVFGPGRVGFVEDEDDEGKKRSRLSLVGRSEWVGGLSGIEEEEGVGERRTLTARLSSPLSAGDDDEDDARDIWGDEEVEVWRKGLCGKGDCGRA